MRRRLRRLFRLIRSAWKVGRMSRDPDPRFTTPRADMHGLSPLEHAALPLYTTGRKIVDGAWRRGGEWTVEAPFWRGARYERFGTWADALTFCQGMPPSKQTGDVWIRFRDFDGGGVQVFDATNPVEVGQRLAAIESGERAVIARDDGIARSLDSEPVAEVAS